MFEFLAGQSWSLMTPNRNGLSPAPGDLFYSQDEPLPGYHPDVRRHLVRDLERAGVHLHPGHRALMPEGFRADRLTTDAVEWSTGQEPFRAELTLWAVGAVRPDLTVTDLLEASKA